jgi:hypothetical protein
MSNHIVENEELETFDDAHINNTKCGICGDVGKWEEHSRRPLYSDGTYDEVIYMCKCGHELSTCEFSKDYKKTKGW